MLTVDKLSFPSVPALPGAAVKRIVELATSHITQEDSILLDRVCDGYQEWVLARIERHEYGWFVFVCSEPAFLIDAIASLRRAGFSNEFVNIFELASAEPDVVLINFDSDGQEVEGLPMFDW
jgi:hypothetical protein